MSGAYVGSGNASGLASFASWRGSTANIAEDYIPYSNWSDVENPAWWITSWKSVTSSGGRLVLGVPLLTSSGESFADGAAGDYDSYFKALGTALVADGASDAILRLGWEFNGNWYAWSLTSSGGDDAANFVSYWQHVVTLLRSIPGENFKFDWNVSNGPASNSGVNTTAAYPGDNYVDYIGVDAYDYDYDSPSSATPEDRWSFVTTQNQGLNFWASFAQQHGKPLTIPEWGNSSDSGGVGGGDNPYYIQQMYDFMQKNDVALEAYFDYQGSLTSGQYPKSAAEYKELWAGVYSGPSAASASAQSATKTKSTKKATKKKAVKKAVKKTTKKVTKKAAKTKKPHKKHKPRGTGGWKWHGVGAWKWHGAWKAHWSKRR